MAVLMSLGGNAAGDGFLLVPLDTEYEAEIALWTDGGNEVVTVQADPMHDVAGLVFSTAAVINISTVPTVVTVHAMTQSASRGDTIIQVLGGPNVIDFAVTAIKQPVVNFNGRFEARFATDAAFPNTNPIYTAALDNVVPANGSNGWTFGLEGEPDFAPGSPVPTNLELTGMGRVIRLNNPVALRPLGHVPAGAVNPTGSVPDVVSTVVSITGKLSAGPDQTFTTGDPLIGQPVNFGPDTYFAGNNNDNNFPGIALAEECWAAAKEPLGLFEIRLGAAFSPPAIYFRGASHVSGFVAKAVAVNTHTRAQDSRPISGGFPLPSAAAEYAEFGLPSLQTFTNDRIDALLFDYAALPAGPSAQRRNLVRRIGHLLGQAPAKVTDVQAQAVAPDVFSVRIGTLDVGVSKEYYPGKVDANLHAWPGGSPGASSVVDYLRQFFSFDLQWHAFAFHSDELCGYHKGTLTGDVTMTGNHIGDPHTHTVNGTSYDFQSVGEFTLLRDGGRMEVQVRQTPVATQHPITDDYSDLTVCVSIITAVAARVGDHRIAYQPGREGHRLQFYQDGKPANLSPEGIDLGGHRVAAFDADGETGLRIDYDDGTVVTATPHFWNPHNVWYINVSVSNTKGDEGIMGFIPKDSWLPRLRNGATVGPKPASQNDRYTQLYKTFADSWRVTDTTSLFVYAPGTSTKTFTDVDWPAAKPPCKLKPEVQIAGMPVLKGMPIAEAEMICSVVADKKLRKNCVFDVATTGDKTFAKGYVQAEDLRLYGTAVQIAGYVPAMLGPNRTVAAAATPPPQGADQLLAVTATVLPLTSGRPTPTGRVTFFIDGVPMKRPIKLDGGKARVTVGPLRPGEHKIRATYSGGGKYDYHSSTSPNLLHTVAPRKDGTYESR